MNHLLSLIGLTLLCAAWITFQLWLKRVDPSKGDYQPGCGACQSNSCTKSGNNKNNEIKTAGCPPGENPVKPPGEN